MKTELRSFEVRLAGTEQEPRLIGYAAVFGQDSAGLPFVEKVRPGAFKTSLESGQDILALVDHDRGKVIGRISNQTLSLREDDKGLLVEIKPNLETTFGSDVVASVKRGDLKNMSIGFVCQKDEWKNDIREIIAADLKEVSIVSMPAYSGTTIQKRNQEGKNMDLNERELRQKLAQAKEKQSALLEKKELTEEERGQQLELAKEIRTLETELASFKPEPKQAAPAVILSAGQDEQRTAFVNYLRGKSYDTRAMIVGTATAGGYLAPDSFLAEVVRKLTELVVMRQVARTITISAASIKIPLMTDSVTAAWTDEATAIAASQPAFDQVTFTPHKLAALTLVSNELLGDSAVAVESLLAQLFAEKIAEVEDLAFFKGNVTGQPKGIMTEAGITRIPTAATDVISADEIIALYDALPPAYRASATWVMNPATMGAIRGIKDPPLYQYLLISNMVGDTPNTIFGRPVLLSGNMDTIAAGKDVILFGNLARAYYIVDRLGLEVQRSVDRYFEQDITAFRAIKRVDAKLVLADACRILKMKTA